MKRAFFGTDGVRGPYGGPVINEAFFSRLGAAASCWLESRGARAGNVVIGRDTRASGASLLRALGSGFMGGGMRAFALGIVPTPAVSRAARLGGAALGAVVTASHNPASDNGIKFFGADGAKLSDEDESGIESFIDPSAAYQPLGDNEELPGEAVLEAYVEAAARILPAGSLRGWKVALDTANGATCSASPNVLSALGAEIFALGNHPDGRNINEGVGSEHPEGLAALVLASGARIGIAHDGDGDRCVLCDELGGVLDGDEVLAILALHALARGTLAQKTLVVTVQSNMGLDAAIQAAGGRVVRSAVGDRYVAEAMRASGASLGGESSGHIICSDFGPTGDGLVAALRVAGVLLETGRPLSELRRAMRRFPQLSRALTVREKRPLEALAALTSAIGALEYELAGKGRVLVRYSGTEPKLRLLVEGPTEAAVRVRDRAAVALRRAWISRSSRPRRVGLRGRRATVCVAHARKKPDAGTGAPPRPLRSPRAPATLGGRFDEIVAHATPAQLYALLYDMPKGGDLHNHAGGANRSEWVYAVCTDPARNGGETFYARVRFAGPADGRSRPRATGRSAGRPTTRSRIDQAGIRRARRPYARRAAQPGSPACASTERATAGPNSSANIWPAPRPGDTECLPVWRPSFSSRT